MKLYLYLLTQTENRRLGSYGSCVVAAVSAYAAKRILPSGLRKWEAGPTANGWASTPEMVEAVRIGTAERGAFEPGDLVCVSSNNFQPTTEISQ